MHALVLHFEKSKEKIENVLPQGWRAAPAPTAAAKCYAQPLCGVFNVLLINFSFYFSITTHARVY